MHLLRFCEKMDYADEFCGFLASVMCELSLLLMKSSPRMTALSALLSGWPPTSRLRAQH